MASARRKATCSVCSEELSRNHKGIRCGRGHHLCPNTCSLAFMNTVFEDPLVSIPAKCPLCKRTLENDIVERVLDPKQRQMYQDHLLRMAISNMKVDGELILSCPFCDYVYCHVGKEEDIFFVSCRNPKCGKTSCFICKTVIAEGEELEAIECHTKCRTLHKQKIKFECILEESNSMPCPKCGLTGMKDFQCSHIACPRCHTAWCYVCGVAQSDMDVGSRRRFYNHFDDWKTRDDRCPMYLQYIAQVNSSFPNEPQGALQKFHENRSKMMLKAFIMEIGEEQFNELRTHFQSVENCGFTMEEIQNAPPHIYRSTATPINTVIRTSNRLRNTPQETTRLLINSDIQYRPIGNGTEVGINTSAWRRCFCCCRERH